MEADVTLLVVEKLVVENAHDAICQVGVFTEAAIDADRDHGMSQGGRRAVVPGSIFNQRHAQGFGILVRPGIGPFFIPGQSPLVCLHDEHLHHSRDELRLDIALDIQPGDLRKRISQVSLEGDHVVEVNDQLFGSRTRRGLQHVGERDAPLIFHQEGIIIAELFQEITLSISDHDPIREVIRRCAYFGLEGLERSLEHHLEIERCQLR